ncbi:hypothetical protein CRYUN_Cryun34aG0030700 [Craigia yunnanensis]
MSAVRSVLRSAASRANATTRLAAAPKPISRPACSPFGISKRNALPSRIFRSPVEMSCCVETMLPYHTATASALLTSMLSVRSSGWTPEGKLRVEIEAMNFSRLAFLFFLISIQLRALTFVQSAELFQHCSENSTYNNNLNHLFSTITNVTQIDHGFYNVSYGENPDQVNAIGLCRGDLKPDSCRSCIDKAANEFKKSCDNDGAAIKWYDECMLRYSNSSIFGKMEFKPYHALIINVQNATNVTELNQVLATLLDGLKTQAASGDSLRKFATGNAAVSDSQTIYALAQCTPDLSQVDCNDCLNNATRLLSQCCSGRQGAAILTPSCNIRYEKDIFYEPLVAMPPTPAANAPVSPPVDAPPLVDAPVSPPVNAPPPKSPPLDAPPPVKPPVNAPPPVSPPIDAPPPVSTPIDAPTPVSPPVDASPPFDALPPFDELPPVDAPSPSPVVTPAPPQQTEQPYIETGEGNMNSGFLVLATAVSLMILQYFAF